ALRDADVLRERAEGGGEHVGEDLVARAEPRRLRTHRLDDAGHVDADPSGTRCAQAHEEADEPWLGVEAVEITAVDGCGDDADEDLVVGRAGCVDLFQPNDLGRPVSVPAGGPPPPSSGCWVDVWWASLNGGGVGAAPRTAPRRSV